MKMFKSTECLLKILGIAVVYFAIARFSLLLAIPPGYASPVWPAAGLALGGALIYGYRIWPGIFLGSLLANFLTSFDPSSQTSLLLSLALPLSIGIGASIQVVVGNFLVKRYAGFPILIEQPKDIFRVIILGAPISCLVSATIGTASLSAAGLIEHGSILGNWRTWWLGDTVGVLIIVPLILAWSSEMKRKSRLWILLPFCIAVLCSVAMFFDLRKNEWGRTRLEFEKQAGYMSQSLKGNITSYLEVLYSVEGLFRASDEVTRNEFHLFVHRYMDTHQGIQALEWVPLVPEKSRQAYEMQAQQDGYPDFQFTEINSSGVLISAQQRSEYFPVYYFEPVTGNEKALGFNL